MLGRRVGRPGLIGTAARTAVIAGTAQAVSGNVARRQQARADQSQAMAQQQQWEAQQQWAAQQAAMAPPAPPAAPAAGGMTDEVIAQLKQLGELHAQGILTDDEFAAQKAKLLG